MHFQRRQYHHRGSEPIHAAREGPREGKGPISINLMTQKFVKALHLARSMGAVLAESFCYGSSATEQMR